MAGIGTDQFKQGRATRCPDCPGKRFGLLQTFGRHLYFFDDQPDQISHVTGAGLFAFL